MRRRDRFVARTAGLLLAVVLVQATMGRGVSCMAMAGMPDHAMAAASLASDAPAQTPDRHDADHGGARPGCCLLGACCAPPVPTPRFGDLTLGGAIVRVAEAPWQAPFAPILRWRRQPPALAPPHRS